MGYLFYFEAFDEQWKDNNPNWVLKIILINQSTSQAKYSLWDMVDQDVLKVYPVMENPLQKHITVLKKIILDVEVPTID
jgi:hypothetical protein